MALSAQRVAGCFGLDAPRTGVPGRAWGVMSERAAGAEVVTRFAPSPTGRLHVGGARTALFCWALARAQGGRFLLRIEDTDRAREDAGSAANILEDLHWLGLDWDEGPVLPSDTGDAQPRAGGDARGVGPFFQSQRGAHYDAALRELIERDCAYPAFESAAELEALRGATRGFRYRRADDWDRAAALARWQAGEPCAIRFRMPREAFTLRDEILGAVRFEADAFDDFVLRRPNGAPTYHLAVALDDAAMGVTHVLRGQEHLNNTPRHIALARALGHSPPRYAHLPVIQNADGSKMSKRDAGDVSVEDFRRAGILPAVLLRFLAQLGFRPGEAGAADDARADFELAAWARAFSLARVGRSNARFDHEKLRAFNQQALAALTGAEFARALQAHAARYGEPDALQRLDRALFTRAVRPRCRTLADFFASDGPGGFALAGDDAYAFAPKAVAKWLTRGEPNGLARLPALGAALGALEEFTPEAIERAVSDFCAAHELKLVAAAQPLRVAVTGGAASPPLGETLALLGQDAVRARIERCLQECG